MKASNRIHPALQQNGKGFIHRASLNVQVDSSGIVFVAVQEQLQYVKALLAQANTMKKPAMKKAMQASAMKLLNAIKGKKGAIIQAELAGGIGRIWNS